MALPCLQTPYFFFFSLNLFFHLLNNRKELEENGIFLSRRTTFAADKISGFQIVIFTLEEYPKYLLL